MKKVMFGLACAAAMAVVADIESANVVGYLNADVRQNLSVQLPTFEGVGSEGIDIQKIIPVPAEGEDLESGDYTIQIFNDVGRVTTQYMYVLGEDIDGLDLDDGYADGWYEEDWETFVEKTLDVGEAFKVYAGKAGGTFQYAGEVHGEAISVPVRQNLSAQGNIRPAAVDIQSIIPVVAEGDDLESGDFTMQIISDTGRVTTQYMYVLGEDIDDGYADGWYEEDWETIAEKTFAPGEGFLMYAAKEGTLDFPAL